MNLLEYGPASWKAYRTAALALALHWPLLSRKAELRSFEICCQYVGHAALRLMREEKSKVVGLEKIEAEAAPEEASSTILEKCMIGVEEVL